MLAATVLSTLVGATAHEMRAPLGLVSGESDVVDAIEADLSARALTGDQRAWNELIRRHDRRVFVSLLSRGVLPARAREIAQETWIRLIEQQRAGRLAELKLPGLAVTQADFLARSDRRRAGPQVLDIDDEEQPIQVADERPDQESRVLDKQQLEKALEALSGCSERSRTIFTSVYREGLSAAEASSRFGISVQRVRQTLCEVRGRLREALGEAA
jgi:RNA polymerase sigma factor (sigma-70 family)